jgi:hypothetical protein
VKPASFAEFVSWLNIGWCLDFKDYLHDGIEAGHAWALGELLEAPAFQNWCMDTFREHCKKPKKEWPAVEKIRVIYETSTKDSKLRKFAAHSMACKNPFEQYMEGSEMYKAWNTLLEDSPEIAQDIVRGAGKKWNGTFPWDDEHRQAYLEDEVDLEQLWEKQILAARSIEDVKAAAQRNCIRSKIELAHLERKKEND